MVFELAFDLQTWSNWASDKLSGRIIGATGRIHQNMNRKIENKILQTLTPYGLHIASELLEAGVDRVFSNNIELQYEIFAGLVGNESAQIIIKFLNDEELRQMLKTVLSGKEIGKDISTPKGTELTYMFLDLVTRIPIALDNKTVMLKGQVFSNQKDLPDTTGVVSEQYQQYIPSLTDKNKRGQITYSLFCSLPDDVKPVLITSMVSEIMYLAQDNTKTAYYLLAKDWWDLLNDMRKKSKQWQEYYEQMKKQDPEKESQ
jgi:hypothetical protein